MNFWGDIVGSLSIILQIFEKIWFVVLPVGLYSAFKPMWMNFAQDEFYGTLEYILLEIIPPADIEKSPRPMEALYNGIHATAITHNAFDELALGKFNPSFSLEIVGDSGIAHFYIRTPKNFRNLIESNIYAHYPSAEIREVNDYVKDVPKTIPDKEWDIWGTEMELVKPDPYPIVTYRYFEEDITGTMIDPLASIIEGISKLEYGQKIWFQIIIAPEKETWSNTGRELVEEITGRKTKPKNTLTQLKEDLSDIVKGIFTGILSPEKIEEMSSKKEAKDDVPLEFKMTPGEKEVVKAVESMIGKNVFKTKMRFVYVGKKENFDKSNVTNFMGALKQFQDQNLNGFKPNDESKTYANYLMKEQRMLYRQRRIFNRYRSRSNQRYSVRFILNTEELATLFHFPDMSVVAPSLRKVESKKGGAPVNLPVS